MRRCKVVGKGFGFMEQWTCNQKKFVHFWIINSNLSLFLKPQSEWN